MERGRERERGREELTTGKGDIRANQRVRIGERGKGRCEGRLLAGSAGGAKGMVVVVVIVIVVKEKRRKKERKKKKKSVA